MSGEERGSYLLPKIEAIEQEQRAWLELHGWLENFLEAHDKLDPSLHPDDRNVKLALVGHWSLVICNLDNCDWMPPRNRWEQELTQPIEVSLWLSDDNPEVSRSITDDSKISVICSPRGVVEERSGQELELAEIHRLLSDLRSLWPTKEQARWPQASELGSLAVGEAFNELQPLKLPEGSLLFRHQSAPPSMRKFLRDIMPDQAGKLRVMDPETLSLVALQALNFYLSTPLTHRTAELKSAHWQRVAKHIGLLEPVVRGFLQANQLGITVSALNQTIQGVKRALEPLLHETADSMIEKAEYTLANSDLTELFTDAVPS